MVDIFLQVLADTFRATSGGDIHSQDQTSRAIDQRGQGFKTQLTYAQEQTPTGSHSPEGSRL